jgi:cell division protease FtsH
VTEMDAMARQRAGDGGTPGDAEPPDEEPIGLDAYNAALKAKVKGPRRRLDLWDRVKILLALTALFAFFTAKTTDDYPLASVADAIDITARDKRWLVWLMTFECLRQLHFLVCEHWARYHELWGNRIFGGFNRRIHRINDWNRYRMARTLKVVTWLALFSIIAADIQNVPAYRGLPELLSSIIDGLPLILRLMFALLFGMLQFVAIFWFLSRGGVDTYFPEDIKTRFTDVWGQDHVLDRIKENVVFVEDPDSIEDKGGYVPAGILLWGPPGTGKTLIAEAVAGETKRPFVFVDPGAFIQMFMGVGVLKVKSLFKRLRKLSVRYGGVIVFFDEADSLGNRGIAAPGGFNHAHPIGHAHQSSIVGSPWSAHPACNGMSYLSENSVAAIWESTLAAGPGGFGGPGGPSATDPGTPPDKRRRIIMGGMGGGGMGTLQALLTEMSGLKKPRGFMNRVVRRTLGMRPKPPPKYRILVMMATNMPDALDPALLRPGRIDRMYRVGYPSKDGRVRTYQGYFSRIRHEITDEQIEKLAVMTPYATGALIKDMVNEALIIAIGDGRDTVNWNDVIRARHLKRLGPSENIDYVERERHAIALHEACHAIAFYRLAGDVTIDLATIEKGMGYLGMVSAVKIDEHFSNWKSDYEVDIMVSLASLVGEKYFYDGDNSSGVSGDLLTATRVAALMEGYWGMGSTISSHAVNLEIGQTGRAQGTERDPLRGTLGQRIEEDLRALFERTRKLIAENRHEILAVTHALESHKTLSGEDVAAIIEGTEGPMIDGRRYHTPEFKAMAEEYHAAAVIAHRTHSSTETGLPPLDPPDLEIAAASPAGG